MNERVTKVWDLPVRLFHWLLMVLVVGSIVSVKIGGNAMIWHGRFGQLIFGLIVFRIIWGVIGSTTARFTHFVRGPATIVAYLQGRWRGIGHNPLGALSVLALLGLIGFQAVSGLFSNDDIAFSGPLAPAVGLDTGALLSGWHRQTEWYIYGLVALHVLAVLFYCRKKGDNIILPMITGNKPAREGEEPARGGGALAFGIALAIALGAMWVTSGALLPPPPPPAPALGW